MSATLTKVHHAAIDGAAGTLMLAALLDIDRDGRPDFEPVPWHPERVPERRQLIERTLLEYLRRPEKFVRLSVRTLRELAAAHAMAGCGSLADQSPNRSPDRSATCRGGGCAARDRRGRQPAGASAHRRAADAVERVDQPAPPLRLHDRPARGRQSDAPCRRLHVQRRGDGVVLRDVAPLPRQARLPSRRAVDRHGPVSVRTGAEDGTFQNRVSALFADLATNEADPATRLTRLKATMDRAKTASGDPRRGAAGLHASSRRRRSPPGRCGCSAGCASPIARRRRSTS